MSDYPPKIYSLSTLNIRQHFNCDYRFHHFRTDFSGESGSGKSLIADFIQLLMVGSGVFKSGTAGVNQRDTSGLVIKSPGTKYGRGYLLLNIEVRPGKYLTLGGYLESSSSQMQFFIIQGGYDFDETLVPMDNPVRYKDLLVEGQIETVDRLQQTFNEKGYLKVVNVKKYHQLLYGNGILAVDLSQSKQSLRSFAGIIRSFSRGKGFYTDSETLKTFLFGDEDHKRLVEKYKEEVQGISLDAQQHERLLEEIDLIRSKERLIEGVATAYKTYEKLKQALSRDSASFWHGELLKSEKETDTAKASYKAAALKRILINQRLLSSALSDLREKHRQIAGLSNKISQAGINELAWKTQADGAKTLLDQSQKNKDMIDKVAGWFESCDQDPEKVKDWYKNERKKTEEADVLKDFEAFLKEQQLVKRFEQSHWYIDIDHAASLVTAELKELRKRIGQLETQHTFADLTNPESLAGWAMQNLPFPLTLEQESMLIHFQPLPRSEPEVPAERYLPFPENLFDQPSIVPATINGFWLELSGIYEYVEKVTKQYLNKPLDEAKSDLSALISIGETLSSARQACLAVEELKEKMESYPALSRAVALYRQSQTELFPEIDKVAELTPTEFGRYLQAHVDKEVLLADFEEKSLNYESAYQNFVKSRGDNQDIQDSIEAINDQIEKQYGSKDFDELVRLKEQQLFAWDQALEQLQESENITPTELRQMDGLLFHIPPSQTRLYEMATEIENEYHQAERKVDDSQASLHTARIKVQEAKLQFLKDHKKDFNPEEDQEKIEVLPDPTAATNAEIKFKLSFDSAGEGIEDQTILQSYSVGILAHKLLPTVFPTHHINENLVGEQIDLRLTDLTRDLQEIGSRKLEILHRVFNEVQTIYNDYLTKVQRIGNYLRNKDRAITGGNHATLLHKPAKGYPDDWMKVFRKRLTNEMQNTGLFAATNQQDIDQIMVNVFREAGGDKEAGYQDLLNPRVYFDLHFDIKLEDGQSNAGSNGQTYTANALLCLARLSLIEDDTHDGIKVMPIDEAEGLGSNYEMLHALAKKEGYQLVTMSIETAGDINSEGQYIYIMHDNKDSDGISYVPPLGIFNNGELTENIDEIFEQAK